MNRDDFNSQIVQWISLDNQSKLLSEKIKDVRDKKNTLNISIINFATQNNMSNSIISSNDCKLKFGSTNVPQTLSLGYIQKCLGEIIKNETQRTQIYEYIKNHREIKTNPEIKRFSNN